MGFLREIEVIFMRFLYFSSLLCLGKDAEHRNNSKEGYEERGRD